MASFCQTCSIDMWGEDTKDLTELMPKEKYTTEVGALALCECCGPIVVDFNGKRMSDFDPHCKCQEIYQEPSNEPNKVVPCTRNTLWNTILRTETLDPNRNTVQLRKTTKDPT